MLCKESYRSPVETEVEEEVTKRMPEGDVLEIQVVDEDPRVVEEAVFYVERAVQLSPVEG